MSSKISQNSQENACIGVADLKFCNFVKKRFQHNYFPVDIAKFFRTTFFTGHLRLMLLKLEKFVSLIKTFHTTDLF